MALGTLEPPAYYHTMLQGAQFWTELAGGVAAQLAELMCRMRCGLARLFLQLRSVVLLAASLKQ